MDFPLKLYAYFVYLWLFIVMASTSYAVAEWALRIKRRSFWNNLTTILNEVNLESGLTKELFEEKKAYFERNWDEIVNSTKGCIKLIDDWEDEKDKQTNELNYQVEILKAKMDKFLRLEVEIDRKFNVT